MKPKPPRDLSPTQKTHFLKVVAFLSKLPDKRFPPAELIATYVRVFEQWLNMYYKIELDGYVIDSGPSARPTPHPLLPGYKAITAAVDTLAKSLNLYVKLDPEKVEVSKKTKKQPPSDFDGLIGPNVTKFSQR